MKARKALVASAALICIFATAGCASTLFFPAKSAEKAADKVIDDIWPASVKPAQPASEARKS